MRPLVAFTPSGGSTRSPAFKAISIWCSQHNEAAVVLIADEQLHVVVCRSAIDDRSGTACLVGLRRKAVTEEIVQEKEKVGKELRPLKRNNWRNTTLHCRAAGWRG
jgi:hypothetical protein